MSAEQILGRLQELTKETPPFTLIYEYFTMEVNPYYIMCDFHMFEEPIRFNLYTDIFAEALGEYLTETKKLRMRLK